jgi:hypothetical protein
MDPVGCHLFSVYHSVGCQPDANFIQSAASWMQILFSRPPARCKFRSVASSHAVQNIQIDQYFACGRKQPNENFAEISG